MLLLGYTVYRSKRVKRGISIPVDYTVKNPS
jgi:hypothetical protein